MGGTFRSADFNACGFRVNNIVKLQKRQVRIGVAIALLSKELLKSAVHLDAVGNFPYVYAYVESRKHQWSYLTTDKYEVRVNVVEGEENAVGDVELLAPETFTQVAGVPKSQLTLAHP